MPLGELLAGIVVVGAIWLAARASSSARRCSARLCSSRARRRWWCRLAQNLIAQLDIAIGSYNAFTGNVVYHLTNDLASGRLAVFGALLLLTGLVAHGSRRRGQTYATALTRRHYLLKRVWMPADTTCITLPGPWRHEHIQANGHSSTQRSPVCTLLISRSSYSFTVSHSTGGRGATRSSRCRRPATTWSPSTSGESAARQTPGAEDGLTASDLIAPSGPSARKAVIVGHGRGGALAWSAVSMEPDLFAGLVTISFSGTRALSTAWVCT